MKTRLLLRPGQNGTKKLVTRFGDRLVAVRYRYDEEKRKRLETVELIVDEAPWEPPAPATSRRYRRQYHDLVGVRVEWHERDLRQRLKQAGAIWRPKQKLWEVSYWTAVMLGLVDRIESG